MSRQKTTRSSNSSNFFFVFSFRCELFRQRRNLQVSSYTSRWKAKWDYPSALKSSDISNVGLFSLKSPASVFGVWSAEETQGDGNTHSMRKWSISCFFKRTNVSRGRETPLYALIQELLSTITKKEIVPDPFPGLRRGRCIFPFVTHLFRGAGVRNNLV